ncbi:ectopic P granules protein 5 homolog isoform X2 [Toxorhynchites rutilus septentrionalis]|uniref:ectopic P granules protein 5 homolog isoform X2 n=1 Tax=Toxorhynchites rutilus septentrionalis TaxID=329112 RepID=UPI002479E5A6|nr:ectopic P granules protein 5 homolog isoform X2 [Toxorhynchites rutilus septentrionalis]
MATLEKPKTKKKSKHVPLVLPDVPVDDLLELDESPDPLSTVDIDFPSTSTSDEAPVIQLSDEKDPTDFEKSPHPETKWQEEELSAEATAPSAPPMMMQSNETVAQTVQAPLYPDLTALRFTEQPSAGLNVTQSTEAIEPFTRDQLAMFYRLDDQLRSAEAFEQEFIGRELEPNSLCMNHPLYQLLQRYAKARADLNLNQLELDALRRKCKELAAELWTLKEQTFYASGKCRDGTVLRTSCQATVASLQQTPLFDLTTNLNDLMKQSCVQANQCTYEVEATRAKIQQKIFETLNLHPLLSNLSAAAPVVLNESSDPSLLPGAIGELRLCISILFSFLRKGITDRRFLADVKTWTGILVATQLRIATAHDHLFVLFHVLRSPSGIADWASPLVQLPTGDGFVWDSAEFQHALVALASILLPIKKRSEFLQKLKLDMNRSIDVVQEEMWAIVDSDGEDYSESESVPDLKEADLVALIDQVPFGCVYKVISLVDRRLDGSFRMNEDDLSGRYLLKVIAFGTTLVELLGNGLITYNTERYRQFVKRLARLIKHTVFYVSDLYRLLSERLTSGEAVLDPYQTARISLEFDVFVVRSAQFIYRSREIGTWQYLTGLPFDQLSVKALWKLYYCLHMNEFSEELISDVESDFRTKCIGDDRRDKFRNSLFEMPSEDLYYLLQVFSSMALARESSDIEFVEAVTLNLFDIGYLNEYTKDFCYKAVKDLLLNIVTKYPSLVTNLLQSLKQDVGSADQSAMYIFKSLPLAMWRPQWDDFELLANWLLNFGFDSIQSSTARVILIHLNYNFDQNQELFLPHHIHVRIACLVMEVYTKHVPEALGSTQSFTASVGSLVKSRVAQEQFLTWCWNVVGLLRLHCMDQSAETITNLLRNPTLILRQVPELERAAQIYQGVTEGRPIAFYLAILIGTGGHSVPEICHKGLKQIRALLDDHRYTIVVRCLQLIVPLFLECPDSLSRCDAFKSILQTLLAADRTYARLSKDQFRPESSAPVAEMLRCMILAQITNYVRYGLSSPTLLVNVWLLCLIELPNWTKDPAVIGLMDAMLGVAYQFPDCWHSAKEIFRPYYARFEDIKASKPTGLLNLLAASPSDLFSCPSPTAVFLSLFTLEQEYEITEIQTSIWHEILRTLGRSGESKISLENAVKKSTSIMGYPSFPASSLTLFKLANLIANCSIKHYMYPIVCQLFFTIYLSRVPMAHDEERFAHCYAVADRFYEYNVGLMKRIKKQLYDADCYYSAASIGETNERQLSLSNHCARLFKTLQLWLEDTQLNKIRTQSIDLPPQFDPHRLASVFQGNRDHWTEFIDLRSIRNEHRELANSWLKLCFRYESAPTATISPARSLKPSQSAIDITDPKQAIFKRLEAYDAPKPPPPVSRIAPVVKSINFATESSGSLVSTLKSDFSILESYARKEFHVIYNEHQLLDSTYLETAQKLYINEDKVYHRSIQCSNSCNGAADFAIRYKSAKLDKNVSAMLADNRNAHDALVKRERTISDHVVRASVRIDAFLRQLVEMYQELKGRKMQTTCDGLKRVGTSLFYLFVDMTNDYNQLCPVTKDVCSLGISQLGFFVIEDQNKEGIKLLTIALKRTDLINMISELLVPSKCPPQYFLAMYGFIIDSHIKKCDTHILFVLLSKFDIVAWMDRYRPKLVDINQLVGLILRGLEGWNQQNAVMIQDLLQRHLTHLFEYDFPEHYGDILQMTLAACSKKKIKPLVLLDLVNSMRRKVGCQPLACGLGLVAIKEEFRSFATQQSILSYKDIIDTTVLLTQHFQQERLNHGLHGLYPKHVDYCEVLSLLFGSMGHAAVVAAIHTYPGVLADELINWIWPPLCEMFSPWLIPYFPQNMKGQQQVANWIQQIAGSGSILPPWSELHADTAFRMIKVFEQCLQYLLETFPSSSAVLGHVFYWYELNFAHPSVARHIVVPIHSCLANLSWSRFRPAPIHISGFSRILQQFIPEAHQFVGHIFLRIAWTPWLQQNLTLWDYELRYQMLSALLMIFVKISYEPNAREGLKIVSLLQEACNYPWHLLEYQGVEAVLDWFVLSTEPSIVLKMPSEGEVIDSAVLDLLQVACGMKFNQGNPLETSSLRSQVQAKRILYVRTTARLLNACGAKYQKLLGTKQGMQAFHNAVLGVLNTIETVLLQIQTAKDREFEAKNLTAEVIVSLQSHGESTAKLFIEAIILWTENCRTSDSYIIPSTLCSIGMCKSFTHNLYWLVEEMLFHYFSKCARDRTSNAGQVILDATWAESLRKIGPGTIKGFNEEALVKNRFLLVYHLLVLQRLQEAHSPGEKILVLQKLFKTLEGLKMSDQSEAKQIMLWGLMVVVGVKILIASSDGQNHLLTLARYLQNSSRDTEGWGEGLLGAIGIRKDGTSVRLKVVAKCLSCVVFLLFGEDSADVCEATEGPISIDASNRCKEYVQAVADLSQTLTNKRYAEMHVKTRAAINLFENTVMVANISANVCNILRLFCDESFFRSVEDVWKP